MSRIETRESVVFFVYQSDFRSGEIEDQLKIYLEQDDNAYLEEDKDYFLTVALGVFEKREELDNSISTYLKKWTIDRIPKLDRAVLEVAAYEIKYVDDVPVSVAINEAVKLAKKYGTNESSSYINGVLSSYEKNL